MQEKVAHPDWCFCEREGLEVVRSENDLIINTFTTKAIPGVAGYAYSGTYNIRRCARCGKGYSDAPAMAA